MPSQRNKEKFEKILSLNGGGLSAFQKKDFPILQSELMCSGAVEQRDASLEAVDQRSANNLKNWQWTTEGAVSTRRPTLARHGGEWPYSFLQAVSSMLVYCYGCTNVGFVDSRRLSHRGLRARMPLYRIPLIANLQRLRLQ
ncbi:hypothetical protein TNCV_3724371 [Trichonephila clavipes]|nr:hypothetical protein TNCV_3724371 [Trichonephila clavipes]